MEELFSPSSDFKDLFEIPLSLSHNTFNLGVKRDPFSSKIIGIEERTVDDSNSQNAISTNSMSLLRKPGNSNDFVRGNRENILFQPGGINTTEESRTTKMKAIQKVFFGDSELEGSTQDEQLKNFEEYQFRDGKIQEFKKMPKLLIDVLEEERKEKEKKKRK